MKWINKFMNSFNQYANSLSMRDWMVITAAVLVVGVVCLKGFGSRKNY